MNLAGQQKKQQSIWELFLSYSIYKIYDIMNGFTTL